MPIPRQKTTPKKTTQKKTITLTPKMIKTNRVKSMLVNHFDYEMSKYNINGWYMFIGSPSERKKKSTTRIRGSIVNKIPVTLSAQDAFLSHNMKAYFFKFSVPRDNAPTGCLAAISPLITSIDYKKDIGVMVDIEIIIQGGFKTSFSELSIRDGYGPMEAHLRLTHKLSNPSKDVRKCMGILKVIDVTPQSPEDCGKTITLHLIIDEIPDAFWDRKKKKYRSVDLRKLKLSLFTLEAELAIAEGPGTAPRFSASSGPVQILIDNRENPPKMGKIINDEIREEKYKWDVKQKK